MPTPEEPENTPGNKTLAESQRNGGGDGDDPPRRKTAVGHEGDNHSNRSNF